MGQASRVAGGNRQDARAAQGEGHRALAPAQGGAGGVHLPRLQHEVNEGCWAPTLLYSEGGDVCAARACAACASCDVVQVFSPQPMTHERERRFILLQPMGHAPRSTLCCYWQK